jgi:hypothetical protein
MAISDQAIQALEQMYQMRIQDGQYWYDRLTGAWGLQGGPTAGAMMPGLDLGGPLSEDASHGNTGVFINGRHLPLQDLMGLMQIVPVIPPGRYWMDAQGNVANEFGMFLGNIWAMAPSSGAPRQGILSTYDKTGCTVIG